MENLSYPSKILRFIMIGTVFLYFALFIILPVGGMYFGAFAKGVGPFWQEIIKPETLHALKLTGVITLITVVINSIAGIVLAILFVRHRLPGARLLNGLIDLPFAISPVVAGFMLIILYGPQGLLGWFFENHDWKVVYAFPGMLLATLFVTLPFVVKEISLVLQEIGNEQEQAATLLGANPWQVFWKITLPSIRCGLLYGITLTVARALGEFGAVLVVSGNIINLTQTATLAIYQAFEDFNYVGSYAVAAVLALISFTLLICLEVLKKKRGMLGHGN
jgi:sulfate/thiosulfate transport system permease protein